MLRKYLLLLSVVLILQACSWMPTRVATDASPDEMNEFAAYQQWQVRRGTQLFQFDVAVEVHKNSLRWVVVNDLGQRLITMHQQGHHVSIMEGSGFNQGLSPSEMVEIVHWVFWPLSVLKLPEFDIQQGRSSRRFYNEENSIEVAYDAPCPWMGVSRYVDPARQLSVRISSNELTGTRPLFRHESFCAE